jgi:hypothetical protein
MTTEERALIDVSSDEPRRPIRHTVNGFTHYRRQYTRACQLQRVSEDTAASNCCVA